VIASLPSPTVGVWHLGPFPLRMYAVCILLGIVVAVWLTGRRLVDRGYEAGQALDVAAYAVPFGIVGGRIYHVITTPDPYWGEGGNPVDALKIWEGGLGIWGAIALGAFGIWVGCRQVGIRFLPFLDAAVPGVALAQAIGRVGNWFNNELYGGPTTLPWGLTIHQWDQGAGRAVEDASGNPVVLGVFHPTFLYEMIWLVVLAAALLVIDKRRALAPGQLAGAVRRGVPRGPHRHRVHAHRQGRDHPRAAAQRLDEHHRLRPRGVDLLVHRSPRRAQRCPAERTRIPECGIAKRKSRDRAAGR
jgi:prolipoprotein diacylglyceryl transferase